MHEFTVKVVVFLTALCSLALGGVFLIVPGWFVALSESEAVNVGWLRAAGAPLACLHGLGLLVASVRRRDTNPLLAFVSLSNTAVSAVLWYSYFAGEFSAALGWTAIAPAVVATLASVMLWAAWVARCRHPVGGTGRPRGGAVEHDPAPHGGPPPYGEQAPYGEPQQQGERTAFDEPPAR